LNKKTTNDADIRWLAIGALAGLLAAGYGILRQAPSAADLPADVIASVNDTPIGRDVLERTLATLAPTGDADRQQVMQRLIDEELLVQRGIELGMTESDSEVRAAIANSLVASITAEADSATPDDQELAQYLADHADRFSFTAHLSVDAWETESEPLAQEFMTGLRTGRVPALDENIRAVPGLPGGMLTIETVRDYLGPAITAAATEMAEGSSAVFARRGRWLVVRVTGKEDAPVTDLDAVRNRVLLDYRRNLAGDLLRNYLEDLRRRADVRVNPN